ncbi:UNVERIFIED_CONTAM: spore germination protein KC [Brevibacillus sp. OAP136]
MKTIQKLLFFTIATLPLFVLTGCWSSVELNDRSFARMMLIDKAKEGIELTLAFPLPNRLIPGQSGGTGEQTGKPYTFISKKGRDIGEAYRKIQADLSRSITFGQTSVIVLGNGLAKEGMMQVLDFLQREPRIHINASIYLTPGKAQELMVVPSIFERFPVDILVDYSKAHVTLNTTVKDCLVAFYHGGDIILPSLTFETKTLPTEMENPQKWMGTGGAGIFRQGKLVASLSTYEMRGAMWVMGQMRNAEVSVKSSTDGKYVDYMVNQTRTKITPSISGDQVMIKIKVEADASLITSDSDVDLLDPAQQHKLEQGISDLVEKRMAKAVERAKASGADVFRFGEYIDWYEPRQWRRIAPQWRELYRKVTVSYDAHVTIKRLGTVKEPLRIQNSNSSEANR